MPAWSREGAAMVIAPQGRIEINFVFCGTGDKGGFAET